MVTWINPNLGTYHDWVFEIMQNSSIWFWVASKRKDGKLVPIEGNKGSDQIDIVKHDIQDWLVNRLREEKEFEQGC